jgi:uncharacterized protein (DUF58 family)
MNTIYGYLPGLFFVFAIGVSYLYLTILRRSLSFEEMSDLSNCKRETEIAFTVKLKNRSPLVCPRLEPYFYISDLFGGDDSVTSSVITLAPREQRAFDFDVRFDHIGSYSAGLKRIVVHDLLGLFSHTIDNPKRYQVDVSPKIFDVDNLHISDTVLTESEKMIVPIASEGSDYIGVREYVMGDPIKMIHWKLSARQENYLTKQFENYGTVGVSVFIDFFSPVYPAEALMGVFDTVVETALSVGNYAEEQGMEFEIVYTDKDMQRRKFNKGHHDDFSLIISDMPRIQTAESPGAPGSVGTDMLREEGRARYTHGNIVFCTASITDEACDILLELKHRRKNPMLFAVVPPELDEQERADLLRPLRALDYEEVPYYVLSSARELGGGEKR